MYIYMIIGIVLILFLAYIDLKLIFVKIDLEKYLEANPSGKNKKIKGKIIKVKRMIILIWFAAMVILGIVSYLFGRYIIMG